MEDRNDHIDQYFRQALDGVTETPPAAVWAALEKRLDGKKRRGGFFWLWLLFGFLAATGLGIFYAQKPAQNKINLTAGASNSTLSNTTIPQIPRHSADIPDQKTEVSGSTVKNSTAVTKTKHNKPDLHQRVPRSISSVENPVISSSQPVSPTQQATADTLSTPVIANTTPMQPDTAVELLPFAGEPYPEESRKYDLETYQTLEPKAGKTIILSKPADTIAIEKPVADLPHAETDSEKAIVRPEVELEDKPTRVEKLKFTAGIKTGYEFGTKRLRANSIVISPYLQYFFNSKWGIMTQPALKYSFTPDAVLLQETYNKPIDSSITGLLPIIPSGNNPGTSTGNKIVYQKTYDSISIKHFLTNTRHWNVDLPLMLVYRMNKKLELYGGLNMQITRVARIGKQQQTVARITKTDTLEMDPNASESDTPALSSVIPNTGIAYSNYQGSAFNNPLINPFKLGVTFGASYLLNKRLRFDILYRQTLSRLNYIPNPQVREIYSQPYLRLTLGYKLTK